MSSDPRRDAPNAAFPGAATRRATLLGAAAAALPATGSRADADAAKLGDFGQAPEFVGIAKWLNSDPLSMAGLRGKVVLVDFWAYSCINCLRTLPTVTRWYDTYKARGLVVVGVHAPEFGFERNTANVQSAMRRFGIRYPVAQDNDLATWRAYANQYWPAEYLIDRSGRIVLKHYGEGQYDEMENAIRTLLAAGPAVAAEPGVDLSRIGSPEMYFGLARLQMLASPQTPRAGTMTYTAPAMLPLNRFALLGAWNLAPEHATSAADGSAVQLRFSSGKVFMVASSSTPVTLAVTVDGAAQKPVTVQESRLYTLFDSNDYRTHMLELSVPRTGLEAFAFTFG